MRSFWRYDEEMVGAEVENVIASVMISLATRFCARVRLPTVCLLSFSIMALSSGVLLKTEQAWILNRY